MKRSKYTKISTDKEQLWAGIEIKILNKELYKEVPKYMTEGAAAVDLLCSETVEVQPNMIASVNTQIAVSMPYCVAGIILPRSSLGVSGLYLANTTGLIDPDYQGEIIVKVSTRQNIVLLKGERFAQLLFIPVVKALWTEVDEFSSKSKRGKGGFGSTGR